MMKYLDKSKPKGEKACFDFEFQRGHGPSCQEMHGDRTKRLSCPIVPAVKKTEREQEIGTGYTASKPAPSELLSTKAS